ncbi:Alpha/beta hydrolase [Rhodovastum atsumiense]|uniref:Alpha/beta hydrolase n=1 Tax=Rhodovastum atsumiense TaxID=504468 RepID=A0A5M6IY01_9PROT|nr:alpha/beta hydrolase [Rhodovastum atsumiense]KAA5613230.1 alpha/beta hydrolase [Rhodovastum atsumiense]CAH2600615.1 Alpha/beta hydrolase [Rhodovastum atsumiense]
MTWTLHPDVQGVLDLIRASGLPPVETLAATDARALYRNGRAVLQPDPPEVALVRDLAGPVPLRLYRGAGTDPAAALPALVYLHGGGWVIGDIDTHDVVCRGLANAARAAVISVDYRLAPEHKFPAAVEDCAAALRFVVAEAEDLGIDPARLAVGGDSAGGNLAAVMAIMARDGAVPPIGYQVLIYPATDLTARHPSYSRVTDGFPLVTRSVHWFVAHYLANPADAIDWRASPLRAPDLSDLPPAFVLTCTHDPLCDEGLAYADRLEREGGQVTRVHLSDQMHGFLTMGRMIRASDMTIAIIGATLRAAWNHGG